MCKFECLMCFCWSAQSCDTGISRPRVFHWWQWFPHGW